MKRKRTVKDMPSLERPYEKCMAFGPSSLSDAELLGVVLKTGMKDKNCVDLAREIIGMSDRYEGLAGIHHLTYEDLVKIKGIGQVKAVQILCLSEIAARISRCMARERLEFTSPQSIAGYFMERMRYLGREEVHVLMFDQKHALIGEEKISVGTVNAALTSPREIFIEALRRKAVHIILIHNHPSGNPAPSMEDTLLTKRIRHAGELIGITLSDHIIIGDQKYYSYRENGHEMWDDTHT